MNADWKIVVTASRYEIVAEDPRKEPVEMLAVCWDRDIATLLAAAPLLLEACEEAFIALPMAKHNEPINARLKAAIAKAKGRS